MKYQIHSELFETPKGADTLAEARAIIRRANGGRLHGKFEATPFSADDKYQWVEGWNLGRQEGCNTAVIVTLAVAQ